MLKHFPRISVSVFGELSNSFVPEQGIHQGDVWSAKLHCEHSNGLIEELRDSQYGVWCIGVLVYHWVALTVLPQPLLMISQYGVWCMVYWCITGWH